MGTRQLHVLIAPAEDRAPSETLGALASAPASLGKRRAIRIGAVERHCALRFTSGGLSLGPHDGCRRNTTAGKFLDRGDGRTGDYILTKDRNGIDAGG